MKITNTRKYSKQTQLIISIGFVFVTATVCFWSAPFVGYKIVALLLLMVVSLLAMLFDIVPVLVAAFLSALIWNFFFIPPVFTFHIHNTEDVLMFFLYFVIALVNAVMTFKIRKEEKNAREKEEKANTIVLYNTLLNSLSHELRTPIATIIGAVDTLKEGKEKLSTNQQNELLQQIDTAGMRLNGQVENLLNMSRLETGLLQLNKQWCDVNELISGIITKLQIDAKGKKIQFTPTDELPYCKIDAGMMEQVLHNILANALEYTPAITNIQAHCSIQQSYLHITIQDNGNGIPANAIENIFNKFYRVPNSKAGGTGLGLSIAKGFVIAHGGVIDAKNILPHGLQFNISIPVETTYINNLKNE